MKVEENLFSPIDEGEILGQEGFLFLIPFIDITYSMSYGKGEGVQTLPVLLSSSWGRVTCGWTGVSCPIFRVPNLPSDPL